MPIYEYQCECGKKMDVLVRGGREPCACDEAMEASGWCGRAGKLTKLVTAANVGRAGSAMYDLSTGRQVDGGECGHCGGTPGSCATDN